MTAGGGKLTCLTTGASRVSSGRNILPLPVAERCPAAQADTEQVEVPATGTTVTQELIVSNSRLWYVDNPHLYWEVTRIRSGSCWQTGKHTTFQGSLQESI